MDAPRRFTGAYRVRFDEAGPDGRLPAGGYLRYIQDVAWQHSDAAGFDRDWYTERGCFWVVRGVELSLVGVARSGDLLSVTTQVIGWRRVWARRRSEVRGPGGEAVAEALTDWVLLNDAGRPVRIPPELEGFAPPGSTFTPVRVELPPTPPDAVLRRSPVMPRDLDPLGHVNNATYVDYLDEALDALGERPIAAGPPRTVRLEYLRPAGRGATIVSACWAVEAGWACRLTDDGADELVRAQVS